MYSIRMLVSDYEPYLPLLLTAEPSEKRLRAHIARGALYVLNEEGRDVSAAVMTMEESGVCELQALATLAGEEGKGYASRLMELLFFKYAQSFETMRVRTAGAESFYEKLGFVKVGVDVDFFVKTHDEPVIDNGVLLTDATVLERRLVPGCTCGCGEKA